MVVNNNKAKEIFFIIRVFKFLNSYITLMLFPVRKITLIISYVV